MPAPITTQRTGTRPAEAVTPEIGEQETPRATRPPSFGVLICIAVLAFLSGLVFFLRFHDFYTNDSPSYLETAQNLASGHGFTNRLGYPELIRTPGYPLQIALFLRLHLGLEALIIFQHLLRAVVIVAVAAVVLRLTWSRMQTLVAGIILCLDLPLTEAANTVMTEVLFTVILCISLWLVWEAGKDTQGWLWSIAAGIVCGAANFIRPAALFFFIPVAAYLLIVRKQFRVRVTFVFVLAFWVPLLLWVVRNYSQTGSAALFPVSAWDMLGYRAAGVLAINDRGDFQENVEEHQAPLLAEACRQINPADKPCLPLTIPQPGIPQKAPYYMRVGRRIVLQHPFNYVRLALRGSALILLGSNAARTAQVLKTSQKTAAKIFLPYTVAILCLGLAGLWSYCWYNRPLFYLLLFTMVYFTLITAGAEAYSRYRVPVMPAYAVLAAAGLEFIVLRVSAIRRV